MDTASCTLAVVCVDILVMSLIPIAIGSTSLKVMTSPIIFGEDVDIKCTFPKIAKCGYSRTWTCGPRYEPVVMNGVSANYLKYIESHQEDCRFSILRVKHFNESDVDIVYKCTYGFDSTERVLELNQHNYEYHPREVITKKNIKISERQVYASFGFNKIFPKPTCTGSINAEDIPSSSLYLSSQRNVIFYQTNVTMDYQRKDSACIKSITITCIVGQTRLSVANFTYPCRQTGLLPEPLKLLSGSPVFHQQSECSVTLLILCMNVLTVIHQTYIL